MVREAPDTQEEAEVCDFRARGAASVPCQALLPHTARPQLPLARRVRSPRPVTPRPRPAQHTLPRLAQQLSLTDRGWQTSGFPGPHAEVLQAPYCWLPRILL